MKVLQFTLSGQTGFFKKPEVNAYYYFTYGNIHKVALLGLLGAIIGLGGYTQMAKDNSKKKVLSESVPEFYEKLHKLQVSIEPKASKGFIPKKVQVFNNSVGYASKEQGGNLIVKEQWLEHPSWKISILLDSKEAEIIQTYVTERRCVYYPYLGKNDHSADIADVEIVEAAAIAKGKGQLCSLFPKDEVKLLLSDDEEEDYTYQYQEKLPYAMDAVTNNYKLKSFIYTDAQVSWDTEGVYEIGQQYKMFY